MNKIFYVIILITTTLLGISGFKYNLIPLTTSIIIYVLSIVNIINDRIDEKFQSLNERIKDLEILVKEKEND